MFGGPPPTATLLRRAIERAAAHTGALTGYRREQDRRRSREAGFGVHLVKPVSAADPGRLLGRGGRRGDG
jgi:CheY-like chemotaxis protein